MTNYREIFRLHSLGHSQRSIAVSAKVSRNTVSKILKKAEQFHISDSYLNGVYWCNLTGSCTGMTLLRQSTFQRLVRCRSNLVQIRLCGHNRQSLVGDVGSIVVLYKICEKVYLFSV